MSTVVASNAMVFNWLQCSLQYDSHSAVPTQCRFEYLPLYGAIVLFQQWGSFNCGENGLRSKRCSSSHRALKFKPSSALESSLQEL